VRDVKGFKAVLEREGLPQDSARLFMKGHFTWPTTDQVKGDIERLASNGVSHLVADLTELTYLDSTGLSTFVAVHKSLVEIGGDLKIVNPRRLIRHLFVSAKLDGVLDIGPPVES
jgi:anti-sigma B factor antagonist